MSLSKIKQLLNTAIDTAMDNEDLDIPDDLPWDVIDEIKRYFRGLNFLASAPYFDVDVIRTMKKKAGETFLVIKKITEEMEPDGKEN
jgi:hypothetical protein